MGRDRYLGERALNAVQEGSLSEVESQQVAGGEIPC